MLLETAVQYKYHNMPCTAADKCFGNPEQTQRFKPDACNVAT